MTAMTLQLGSKVFIDGEIHFVASAVDVLDGDFGCGIITRKKILTLRTASGFERIVMTEEEE